MGVGLGALGAAVWPPLPRPLPLPLKRWLGTAGALLLSFGLPSLPVRLRVTCREGTVRGGDGGFIGGELEEEEGGAAESEAGDQGDESEEAGGGGRVDGGSNADGKEDEEEEGIAAGEDIVEAVVGIGIGV